MSHVIAFGSGSTLMRFDIMRGPSSSWTMASTYGGLIFHAFWKAWCAISKEWSVPRPLACIQPTRREWQRGQRMRG